VLGYYHDVPDGTEEEFDCKTLPFPMTLHTQIHVANSEDECALAALFSSYTEWFCTKLVNATAHTPATRATFPVASAECSLQPQGGKLLFSFTSDRGMEIWRVVSWERGGSDDDDNRKLLLRVERAAGRERAQLEFVPRTSVSTHTAHVRLSRETRLAEFAATLAREAACELDVRIKLESARLNHGRRSSEPGRFARLLFTTHNARLFATGAIADAATLNVESFLAHALLWFARAREMKGARRVRASHTSDLLWLVVAPAVAARLVERCALLKDGWRDLVSVWATNADDDFSSLARVPIPMLEELLARAPRTARANAPPSLQPGDTARRIIAFAPEAITSAPARHGETLRFRGLAFARIRRMMNREHVWFGVEASPSAQRRQVLTEKNWMELATLIESLSVHRQAYAADRRHAFYTTASESWLEHLLRERVTRLDPGLVLAPLYAQVRVGSVSQGGAATARPLDLLARRRDGRLVVIELKTAEDAALPIQAADYWRQTEAHRRAGSLAARNLFGDAPLADAPPLVYVVAPTLRFARSFEFLASLISPLIEIYRFDINEDWRAGIRVQRRTRA
jgi:hypothetical protein